MKQRLVPPPISLLLAFIGISFAAPLARLAGVDGFTAAWWRLLVGSMVTLFVAAASDKLPPPYLVLRSVPSGVFLALHLALWLESLRHMSIASSTGIVVSYPVIIGIYEALIKRYITVRGLVGVLLGFLGIAVLSTPWAGATVIGAALSFTAAVFAAMYFLIGRSLRVRGASTLEYTSAAYFAAFLVLLALTPLAGSEPWSVPSRSIPYLVLLGLVPMLLGHSTMNYALGFYPATIVTGVALLEPYGASLLGWLLLGEQPPLASIPGTVLSISGAWLALTSAHPVLKREIKGGR
ncbi:DMT family transporter [Pyrofollis japonicus]|uniref:DMT family transporter n=1 Tax=Pyrofollis japonicus TaxID=3060460 RepID=UPI00295B924F|nr:DMT family transporter [Pyrofollis japonicus]BEP17172.1 DMT family transporter [Pyrofollis japonicus]